jgi:hypothetical protein
VEEIFGWLKTVGGLRKTRHRGLARRLDVQLRTGGLQLGQNAQPDARPSMSYRVNSGQRARPRSEPRVTEGLGPA